MHVNKKNPILIIRLILGFIFFFQGFGKFFKYGIDNFYNTFFLTPYSGILPEFLLILTVYYTSIIELIGGLMLIIGIRMNYALYFLASVLIIVTLGHGITDPIWDLSHIFYRSVFLVFLLFFPTELNAYSVEHLIKRK